MIRTRLDGNELDITFDSDLNLVKGFQGDNIGYQIETYKVVFKS